MAKTTGSTRTTISVPSDLKRRMDKVKEPVNWSALACVAFEQKLAEFAKKKEKKNMDDVISRLRASKQSTENTLFAHGFEDGQAWAKDDAEAAELQRLEKFRDELAAEEDFDWDWFFREAAGNNAYSVAEILHSKIAGLSSPDRSEAADFWNWVSSEYENPPEYYRGFAQGALEIWGLVQDQL